MQTNKATFTSETAKGGASAPIRDGPALPRPRPHPARSLQQIALASIANISPAKEAPLAPTVTGNLRPIADQDHLSAGREGLAE